jgi:hypothetical protein
MTSSAECNPVHLKRSGNEPGRQAVLHTVAREPPIACVLHAMWQVRVAPQPRAVLRSVPRRQTPEWLQDGSDSMVMHAV